MTSGTVNVDTLVETVRNRPAKMPYAPFDPNSPLYYIEESELSDLAARARDRDKYREWVARIWTNAEQESWDESNGPDSWAIELQRTYRQRAEAAEADRDRLRAELAAVESKLRFRREWHHGERAARKAAESEADRLARRVAELENERDTALAAVGMFDSPIEAERRVAELEADRERLREGLSEVRLRHMYSEPKAGEALAVWVLNGWAAADFAPKDEPYASSEARYQERIRIRNAASALAGDGGGA